MNWIVESFGSNGARHSFHGQMIATACLQVQQVGRLADANEGVVKKLGAVCKVNFALENCQVSPWNLTKELLFRKESFDSQVAKCDTARFIDETDLFDLK